MLQPMQKKIKFSTKTTSNLITYLKRCCLSQYTNYMHHKQKYQEKSKKIQKKDCQTQIKSFFKAFSSQQFAAHDVTQKALTKALIKSIACDQLPLSIVDSKTFRDLLLTAEPKFVIPRRSTIRNILIPTVVQQMKEEMRHQLACLSHVYLTIDLWTNRNMSNFLGITAHFIDATWKLCGFYWQLTHF